MRTSLLTPQQKNVLTLAATGKNNAEIGEALVLGKRTIDAHMRNAFKVLGVNDRASAVVMAIHYGEIDLGIVVNTILADRAKRRGHSD
jgi:Response regulator containing a CheY-like receiver domain and an HTH DNA-binding domain